MVRVRTTATAGRIVLVLVMFVSTTLTVLVFVMLVIATFTVFVFVMLVVATLTVFVFVMLVIATLAMLVIVTIHCFLPPRLYVQVLRHRCEKYAYPIKNTLWTCLLCDI